MTKFDILTLFPNLFSSPLKETIYHRAQKEGFIEVTIHNIRDFTSDKHHTTDDYPYGGGQGMVMKPEPIIRAIETLRSPDQKSVVLLMTPQGRRFDQKHAAHLSKFSNLILVCGRYEGLDERIREYADDEISIGDYILSGGEIAALVLMDTVIRLIPGVLGNPTSAENDSFCNSLLEHPQYTRPRKFRGLEVPDVLLSGDHDRINKWRHIQSLKRTLVRRPDLLEEDRLSEEDSRILSEIKEELNSSTKW